MINLHFIDLNITTVCQNRCAACSHAIPFSEPYMMDVETAVRDLAALVPILHVKEVHLVGGEPLLHPKVGEFVKAVRNSGIADTVIVVTNGRAIPKMPESFWEMKAEMILSIYDNLDPEILPMAIALSEKYGFKLIPEGFARFFTQFRDGDGSSFYSCKERLGGCYTVHEGKFFLCAQSCFFPSRFLGLTAGIDGLALEGITENGLRDFIGREKPLNACRICGVGNATTHWHECKTEAEWIIASTIQESHGSH